MKTSKNKEKKRNKKESIRQWDNLKQPKVYVIRVSKEEEKNYIKKQWLKTSQFDGNHEHIDIKN